MSRVPSRRRSLVAAGVLVLALAGLSSPLGAHPTGDEPAGAGVSDEYALGKKAAESKDWPTAIHFLSRAAVQDDRNPDLENLLGYAYRQVGRYEDAFRHYAIALRLNPRHRGAHEYIGEAYLLVNDLPKAEEHLAALKDICLIPCEELSDLANAIAAYRTRQGR